MREGPPGYPKGSAFIAVGREKRKGKRGEGAVEPMGVTCGIYIALDQHRRVLSADAQSKEARPSLHSYAGGIMSVPVKGSGRIDLPDRETRPSPAHSLLSPIHERNRERTGWLTSLPGK